MREKENNRPNGTSILEANRPSSAQAWDRLDRRKLQLPIGSLR